VNLKIISLEINFHTFERPHLLSKIRWQERTEQAAASTQTEAVSIAFPRLDSSNIHGGRIKSDNVNDAGLVSVAGAVLLVRSRHHAGVHGEQGGHGVGGAGGDGSHAELGAQ
jgi:hypothetical protein